MWCKLKQDSFWMRFTPPIQKCSLPEKPCQIRLSFHAQYICSKGTWRRGKLVKSNRGWHDSHSKCFGIRLQRLENFGIMFHQSPFRSADNNLGLSLFKLPNRQYSSFVPPVPHVSHVTHSKIPTGYVDNHTMVTGCVTISWSSYDVEHTLYY